MSARRGEVWLVDHGPPPGDGDGASAAQPVVVVSADALGESAAGVVLVVPTTVSRNDIPSHVAIDPALSGLESVRYAKCEDLRSVSEERLIRRLGAVSADALAAIARVLTFLLDL